MNQPAHGIDDLLPATVGQCDVELEPGFFHGLCLQCPDGFQNLFRQHVPAADDLDGHVRPRELAAFLHEQVQQEGDFPGRAPEVLRTQDVDRYVGNAEVHAPVQYL